MHQHFIWFLVDGTLYEMVLLQMRERCGSSSNAEVAVEQGGQQAPELVESWGAVDQAGRVGRSWAWSRALPGSRSCGDSCSPFDTSAGCPVQRGSKVTTQNTIPAGKIYLWTHLKFRYFIFQLLHFWSHGTHQMRLHQILNVKGESGPKRFTAWNNLGEEM